MPAGAQREPSGEGTVEARTEWLEPSGEQEPTVFEAEAVGRYVVVRELAAGGMATVHLARFESALGLERVVALKRIHPHLSRERRFVEMFFDEARLAARIDHPFVCRVLDFGQSGGTFFLAMEYLAGEPISALRRALRKRSALLEDPRHPYRVARIVADLAEGLHAAHELRVGGEIEGLVHRDVSPGNLYLLYDGTVRVADFGIARAAHRLHRTETGTVKGTFAYSAPEQLRGERLDRRADVWSLGVVLWELLTGQKLFRRGQPAETVRLVSTMPIAPPSSVRASVPTELDAIVLRALQRDPARRFPTARALAEALEELLGARSAAVSRGELAGWLRELVPGGAERVASLLREATEPSELERTRVAGSSTDAERTTLGPVRADRVGREGGGPSAEASGAPRRAGPWGLALTGALLLGGAGAWLAFGGAVPATPADPAPAHEEPAAAGPPRPQPGMVLPSSPPPAAEEEAPEPAGASGPATSAETDGEGTVHVTTEGGWALVRWRGRELGRTPLQATLPAGRHELELLPGGSEPARRVRVTVKAGRQVVVGVPLGAEP